MGVTGGGVLQGARGVHTAVLRTAETRPDGGRIRREWYR